MTVAVRRFEVSHMIGDGGIDPEQAELCARMIARHAKDPADGDMLAGMLGLDEGFRAAVRIMSMANGLPAREPGRMIAPALRYRRARATRGRKS